MSHDEVNKSFTYNHLSSWFLCSERVVVSCFSSELVGDLHHLLMVSLLHQLSLVPEPGVELGLHCLWYSDLITHYHHLEQWIVVIQGV